MNYSETLSYLFNRLPAYHRIGKAAYKNNLDNTLALDSYFGHPHRKWESIHIAGTNGKGSVSHMTASVLQAAGFRTGLYTSPHLRDFRERIRVDGMMITMEEVVSFVELHRAIIEEVNPSFFELTVAMAFDHFARQSVDIAVIEVGLGGRLDSTNIITPVLSVITNIGHDHMDLLGDTIEKVAAEKAGIIKPGIPVLISETDPLTAPVFNEKAILAGSELSYADTLYDCQLGTMDFSDGSRNYSVSSLLSNKVISGKTPLGGDYQTRNIRALYSIFDILRSRFGIDMPVVADGIANVVNNTGFAGRWQVLSQQPLTICDTGHNREGLQWVLAQLDKIKARKHMVIGFVNDKDLASVLPLFPSDAHYYFARASVERALDPVILKNASDAFGLKGEAFTDVSQALEAARKAASASDLIFIGGSTFIVAEVV